MIIIGIHGKKYAGKDSICDAIKSYYSHKVVKRIAFADACKQEVANACCVSIDYMEQHKEVFRPMYQWWGTDFRRNLWGKDYWVHKWLNQVVSSGADIVVTPDVRFLNEINVIRNYGGYLWKVERKEFELGGHKESNPTLKSVDIHQSETELDSYTKFDVYITNGGTLENLKKDVHLHLDMLKYKV